MKRSSAHIVIAFTLASLLSGLCYAQESVFTGLKSNMKKADEYYQHGAYDHAAPLYMREIDRNPQNHAAKLRLANSYYQTNQMERAVEWYEDYERNNGKFSEEEERYYASALQASGYYNRAIERWQKIQDNQSELDDYSRSIWQLQNIQFLKEDSANYRIHSLSINTADDETGPALHNSKLLYMSNRATVSVIKRQDAGNGKAYFSWLESSLPKELAVDNDADLQVGSPTPFGKQIKSRYHKGGLSIHPDQSTMVYAKVTGNRTGGTITSKLFFGDFEKGKWRENSSFPFNDDRYSILHPHYAEDGNKLYFASDMPGGFGGLDLYYSVYKDNRWSKPVNLGKEINTSKDEGHPFLRESILYFSSNGHPGLGGLDIFYVDLKDKPISISNHGYPVNTRHDDFNLILDETGINGFFTSNRRMAENRGDDIFYVAFTKLTFPLVINGNITFKKFDLVANETSTMILDNASITLIESESKKAVFESKTDGEGRFSIEIPYESQFMLEVNKPGLGTAVVSMEIPNNHRDYLEHEIVIVQELFESEPDESPPAEASQQPN